MSIKNNLIAIAAVSTDGTIGIDNEIPWRIPEDFKHFRKTTIGHTLLVGYTTYLTLPEKAFEGRNYIILNSESEKKWDALRDGVVQFNNLNDLSEHLKYLNEKNETVFLAGGAMMYNTFIDQCGESIITWVYKEFPNGNRKFPIDKIFSDFELVKETDISKSVTGLSYKTSYYKNNNGNR